MPEEQVAVRPSGRTILITICGFGAAALVTSISAMGFGANEQSVRIATVGGTAILVGSAVATALCGILAPERRDRRMWAAIGTALVLTSAGSGVRAWGMIAGVPFATSVAEACYGAGLVILAVTMIVWTAARRREVPMGLVISETAALGAFCAMAFWFTVGQPIIRLAAETGAVPPGQMTLFLAFLVVVAACALLMLVTAGNLARRAYVVPWSIVGASVLMLIVGDVAWLSAVAGYGWVPGSLTDFIHISGHVLIAIGASLALDGPEGSAAE